MKHTIGKRGVGLIELIMLLAVVSAAFLGGWYFRGGKGGLSAIEADLASRDQAKKQIEEIKNSVQRQIVDIDPGNSIVNMEGQGLDKFPSSILSLSNLEILNLSNNELTGAIPAEIRQLKNLKSINVSNNQMTGIPAEIGQLTKLEYLDYSHNQITGLPYEIGNLTNQNTLS